MDTTQTLGFGYNFRVDEVDDDEIASVTVTFDSVLFKQDSPAGKIEYDSSNPPPVVSPTAAGFAALVGQNFSMKISPNGQVSGVVGVEAMLKNMIENLDLPGGPEKDALEKSMTQQFGDQAITETMENLTAIYPDKRVAVGDSWTKRVVISNVFPMILDNTFTLRAIRDGVAFIDFLSTMEPNPSATPIEVGLIRENRDELSLQAMLHPNSPYHEDFMPIYREITAPLANSVHIAKLPGMDPPVGTPSRS